MLYGHDNSIKPNYISTPSFINAMVVSFSQKLCFIPDKKSTYFIYAFRKKTWIFWFIVCLVHEAKCLV